MHQRTPSYELERQRMPSGPHTHSPIRSVVRFFTYKCGCRDEVPFSCTGILLGEGPDGKPYGTEVIEVPLECLCNKCKESEIIAKTTEDAMQAIEHIEGGKAEQEGLFAETGLGEETKKDG